MREVVGEFNEKTLQEARKEVEEGSTIGGVLLGWNYYATRCQ